jgi:NitT/TauT family transport system permease protein
MSRNPYPRRAIRVGGVVVQWAVSLGLLYLLWRWVLTPKLNSAFFAGPDRTWAAFKTDLGDGVLRDMITVTLKEVLVGFGLGTVIGIVLALVIGLSPALVGKLLEPINTGIYAMPKFVLAPILFVWIGNGFMSRTYLVLLATVPVVTLYMVSGIRTVDPATTRAMRMMGANRRQIAWKLLLPHTSSYLFTSIAFVIPHALTVAIGAEIIFGASDGLGGGLFSRSELFNSAGVLSTLLTATVISAVLLGLSGLVTKRLPGLSRRGPIQ